ncbi:hypothetical protein VWO27_10415, partial [Campylobacter coli]|nr:hypothetical protein [Campylobacter coli]
EDVGEAKKWMLDGMMVDVLFHNGKAIGVEVPQVVELKIVETATKALKEALDEQGLKYGIDEGGGAFYGPKIDIKITDALKRK